MKWNFPGNSLANALFTFLAAALLLVAVDSTVAFDQNPRGECVTCTPSRSNNSTRDDPSPPQSDPQPPAPGEQSFAKGEELFQAGNYQAALAWLERAVREAPGNADYQRLLATCRREHQAKLEREQLARRTANVRESTLNQQRREVVSEALQQLSSSESSSVRAARETTDEAVRDQAGCGYNHRLCAKPDRITISLAGSGGANLPAVVALKQRIPERYKSIEQVKQSVAWFTKLEVLKVETQVQLALLNDEINSGNTPMGIFAKVEQLQGKLLGLEADQKNTKTAIETIVRVQLD